MSSSDNSDRFPDMSLPEKTELTPYQPLSRAPTVYWREGDRILAPWEPDFLYVGRIAQIDGQQALIQFDDGDSGWVLLEHVRGLSFPPGQKVWSRRRMGLQFHSAEIVEVRGDDICLIFEDGQADEWVPLAGLRLAAHPGAVGAVPTKVASNLAYLDHLRPGDRVWAPWNSAMLFAGTVDNIQDRQALIHFDDGDQGWVLIEQLVPLEIPVGLRILGRWKMGAHYFVGTVAQVRDDQVYVVYDDGDREWTRAAALAVPCQPFGPDARPTKTAFRWNFQGWVWPLVLGLTIAGLRIACR